MARKVFSAVFAVSMIILLVSIGTITGVMYDYLGEQVDKQMRNEARLVASGLETYGEDYLSEFDEYRRTIDLRITLIDMDGNVLYENMANSDEMDNHFQREEVQEALNVGEGSAVRRSATLSIMTRYYAIRISNGNILRLSTNHYSVTGLTLENIVPIVIIALLLICLSGIISRFVALRIIKPINDIDLNNPDINENYDEISPLVKRIHEQNEKINLHIDDLRRHRDEFRIIIGNMNEGLLIIDKDHEILNYNESALKILNADDKFPDGVGGKNVFCLNRSEPFIAAVEESLRGINSQTHLSMENATYEIIANPVYDREAVTGAILLMIDITEREASERIRREFTSNVSHELKTPLTSIYGVSDMLASGIVKPDDIQGFAITIKEESSRLITLIEDIINLSRLDENLVPQDKTDIELYSIVKSAVERLSSKAAEMNVDISVTGELTYVHGVGYIIDEIVYNLCENAIKYNRIGGSVFVQVYSLADQAVLKVSDTGIGIPKGDIDRVFERFYRVDKSHSRQIAGTGLGLSIVKHAVAFHEGTIELESRENEGTTVTVRFPKPEKNN